MARLSVLLGLVALIGFLPSPLDSKMSDEQEPCNLDQYVVLNPDTNKPYWAPRLCSPDRIFIFGDQQCHDPRNLDLCPPGRRLYETMYGTPICQCPDGTYERNDDLNNDVCVPLLTETDTCPPGQVFWFRDFSQPAECLPDPCGDENFNRGPNDLPFLPFSDGRCFQMGSMPNICPAQTWYSLALGRVQGICSSLQEAGYQVFDQATLAYITEMYGPSIPKDNISVIQEPTTSSISGGGIQTVIGGNGLARTGNEGFSSQGVTSGVAPGVIQQGFGLGNERTVGGNINTVGQGSFSPGDSNNLFVQEGILQAHIRCITPGESGDHTLREFFNKISTIFDQGPHNRSRRSPLPHASPGNVFDPKLAKCQAGAERDLNAKCRQIILQSTTGTLTKRDTNSVPPTTSCPEDEAYNTGFECESTFSLG